MSRELSPQLISQMVSQVSGDPFLMLVTLDHADFDNPYYLVNNSENITSRGQVYTAFPMSIVLPADDNESNREVTIIFDNTGLDLVSDFRLVTSPISVTLELILASLPDVVEISFGDLKIQNISYNKSQISAKLYLDDFLNTEMPSEKYDPTSFPGIF